MGSKLSYCSSPSSGQLRSKKHQREILFPSSVSLGHSTSLHLSFPPFSSLTTMAQDRSPAFPVPPSWPLTQGTEKPEWLFPEQEAKSDAEVTQEHRPLPWKDMGQAEFQLQSWIPSSPPATMHCHRATTESPPLPRGGLGCWGDMESAECPKGTPLHSRGCVPEETCRGRSSPF